MSENEKLSLADLEKQLQSLDGWKRTDQVISKNFQFKNFLQAIAFVNQVAERAEAQGHHPDMDIRWNKVLMALTTHDAGGLTMKDFELAKQIEACYAIV